LQNISTFAELPLGQQAIINRTRIRLHDTDELHPWFDSTAGDEVLDIYTQFLDYVCQDINLTLPIITSYSLDSAPDYWYPTMEIGLTCEAIQARISKWTEVPNLSGFSGPFADFTSFMKNWSERLTGLQRTYELGKRQVKVVAISCTSGGVGSVDMGSYYGRAVPQIALFRALPSWFWAR
jgi:hypothetical protein